MQTNLKKQIDQSITSAENIIQKYRNFNADGLNQNLSMNEKSQIIKFFNLYSQYYNELNTTIDQYDNKFDSTMSKNNIIKCRTSKGVTYERNIVALDMNYAPIQQIEIFNDIEYPVIFMNSSHKRCKVMRAYLSNYEDVYLKIGIRYGKYWNDHVSTFYLSLDRFLYLIQKGDFTGFSLTFKSTYLIPYAKTNQYLASKQKMEVKIMKLSDKLKSMQTSDFFKSMTAKYEAAKAEIEKDYVQEIKNIQPITTEKEKTKKQKQFTSANTILKNIWNTTISDEDKAYFMGWLCKHITYIYIRVLANGASDEILSKGYPENIYGTRVKTTADTGSWDAASGYFQVDSTAELPESILKTLFIGHTYRGNNYTATKKFYNLDLCLFLLGKYNKYGFTSGNHGLNSDIQANALVKNEFPNYIEEFKAGFNTK